jgi:hypothetical protein
MRSHWRERERERGMSSLVHSPVEDKRRQLPTGRQQELLQLNHWNNVQSPKGQPHPPEVVVSKCISSLEELLKDRKQRLDDSLILQQFYHEVVDELHWINILQLITKLVSWCHSDTVRIKEKQDQMRYFYHLQSIQLIAIGNKGR